MNSLLIQCECPDSPEITTIEPQKHHDSIDGIPLWILQINRKATTTNTNPLQNHHDFPESTTNVL